MLDKEGNVLGVVPIDDKGRPIAFMPLSDDSSALADKQGNPVIGIPLTADGFPEDKEEESKP